MAPPPLLEERAAQPYLGIAARVTGEAEFRSAVDRGFPELFGWLRENDERSTSDRGTRFRACVERYITDPSRESDWSKWKTELAYLTTSS